MPDSRPPRRADPARPRTGPERDALAAAVHYARVQDLSTPAERRYLDVLPEARRAVLHRFVGGLLRGDPAGLADHRLVAPGGQVSDDPAPLGALSAARLQSSVAPLPADCESLALLPFPSSDAVVAAPVASVHGYDRFRLSGPAYRIAADSGAATPVEHPVDLVPLVAAAGAFADAGQADRIRDELAESVANLALARLAGAVHAEAVDAAESPLLAVAEGVSAADPGAAFERVVTDGHPFHPGAKIRRGMTPAGGLAYAPEFTDRVDLRFVAVRRDHARSVAAGDGPGLTARLLSTFDGLADALAAAIPAGRGPAEYAVVPAHPWQFARELPERYARQRADGRVAFLDYTHPATPQLNLRTVVPFDGPGVDGPPPHLKLAIGVQTTNVVRTLSPHAVTNGPRITECLRAVAASEDFEHLGLLEEPAATCYYAPGGPHLDGEAFDDARHLSALFRAAPRDHRLVGEDARAVVASSLLAAPTGRPLVCDLAEQYATVTGADDAGAAAVTFVDEYAGVVVPEQLGLLTGYGVALESHLQNSLVVFEGSRPVATLVRDFGGIRVHGGRLADRGLSVEPYPESDVAADGEAALYRKLYYALFQNHLAELVAALAHGVGADERACWARVRAHCEEAFAELRADPAVPDDRVRRDERALFADPAVHKALTAMRLRGKRHEYVTSRVSNPLVAADRG